MLPHENTTRLISLDMELSSRPKHRGIDGPRNLSTAGGLHPKQPPTHPMDRVSWLMLISLSILWGGSFLFTEIALVDLPPLTLVLCRVSIATMVLWWVVLLRDIAIPRDPKFWAGVAVMGGLNNLIPFCLIVWSQTQITSSLAAILNATTPLFTLLIAHITTDTEKLTLRKTIGVLIGFGGVIVIFGLPTSANSLGLLAPCAALLAAFSYGCAGVFGRRFATSPPILTAAGMTSASSLMLLPLSILINQPWHLPVPTTSTILAVLGFATLSTALAYILYFAILKRAGASNLLLVTFLIPVSAILLGVDFLGEVLLGQHMIGMAVIGLGLLVIDGRILSRPKPAQPVTTTE